MNLRQVILSNFAIKVSAGLLSIVLWTYIWGERKANNEIMGEVIQREFKNIPLALLKDPDMKFEVVLSYKDIGVVTEGEKDLIEKMDRSEIIAYIDIRGLGTGNYQLPPVWKVPLGVKIVAVIPEFITVSIEDKRISEVKPVVEAVPEKRQTEVLEAIK